MKKKYLLIISSVLFGYNLSYSQAGSLDTSFDPGMGPDDRILTTSIQNDGKIIIGGRFTSYNGVTKNYITRLNTDGSIDNSFDQGTGAGYRVLATSIQSDGKIILVGQFTTYNEVSRNRIARLNTDGSLDTSFDPGTGLSTSAFTLSIQSDGKILIAGGFSSYNGTVRNNIARLNVDGSLDFSFDPELGTDDLIQSLAIQDDGKIIIGGQFTTYNGIARNHIARLNADGSLDTSFDPGAGVLGNLSSLWSISVQNDGKIIIGGNFETYDGTARNDIARLNDDGSLDISFDTGLGSDVTVYTTSIQSDGKILIGGNFNNYDGVARKSIARLNSDGSLDTTFDPGSGASNSVEAISIQSNGKVIIGGRFTSYNGTARMYIARLETETLGISQLTNENENVTLFPNPFSHSATITVDGNSLQNATVRIYNMTGALVQSIDGISGNTIEIKRNELGEGMYFYQLIENDNIHSAKKFIIAD